MNKLIVNGFITAAGSGITTFYLKRKHKKQIKKLNTLHEIRHTIAECLYENKIDKLKKDNDA